ncbi:hypothetical protein AAC387_Pa12g2093 [Persea americana]
MSSSNMFLAAFFFLLPSLLHPAAASMPPDVVQDFLDAHNKVRKSHNLPLLKWDIKCENYAKWYSEQRSSDCAMVHSTGDFGECLFWGSGDQWKGSQAVEAWAAEKPYYDYKNNKCIDNQQCLHYTQLVWKNTEGVGCYKGICKGGDTYITCEYYPHGNILGSRPF